jgi:vacuolar protein sorting-associated protein 53
MVDSVADAELVLEDLGLTGGVRSLSDSCMVVDSLGASARRDLLKEFVQLQLVPYEGLFGPGQQHFQLDQVERRWAWFKRLLKYVDNKFGTVFPAHWRLPLRLCLEFVETTKMHIVGLLTEMESSDRTDVHALLKALQSTLRFEQEMSERFNLLHELQQNRESEAAHAQQRLAEAAEHNRLKKDDKLMYVPTDHTAKNMADETESGFLTIAHGAIVGGMSGMFDNFLGSYVLLERQNLEDMLARLSQEEDTTAEGVGMGGGSGSTFGNVYGSSSSMFVFIKNSIKRCTALTNGQTFLSLSKEFKTCMQHYIELLLRRCPPATQVGHGANGAALVVYRLPPGGEVVISHLINTGEYCAEVVPQLEQMIQQKMQPSLADKVSFDSEADAFMDLVAHCIKVLVSGVMDRLEPSFRTMQAVNWGAIAQVGEESAYLHTFNAVLAEAIPKIRDSLSSSYFNNLCNKIATEVLQRYVNNCNL